MLSARVIWRWGWPINLTKSKLSLTFRSDLGTLTFHSHIFRSASLCWRSSKLWPRVSANSPSRSVHSGQGCNITELPFQETPREIGQKLWTLKQSCRKVENACYAIAVRGSEIPKNHWADLFSKKEEERGQEDFFH